MRQGTKLKVGDRVLARFLGEKKYCEVLEVHGNKYKIISSDGTVFPNSPWRKDVEVDKKGHITSPWFIEEKLKIKINYKTNE